MESEVFFRSAGLRCAADLYLPDDLRPGARRPGLVIGHGFSVVKEALVEQGRYFARSGFVTLAIDYRTFGRSEGKPRGQLFPVAEAEDYRNAISHLASRSEVDPDRIGIWGTSFAGGLVIYVAALDRRVKATVSQVPVVDGYRWMKLLRSEDQFDELRGALEADRERRYQGGESARIPVTGRPGDLCGLPSGQQVVGFFAGARELMKTWEDTITLESVERIFEWSPISVVDRITPRPLLIVSTAGYDVVHPARFVTEAYEKAREPKRLVLLPFDQLGLYSEPGLTISLRHAADFFVDHLGETETEKRERQLRAARGE
jgi:fermentation-respiration switch protein FrsA (DUF1100 family)